MNIFKLKTKGKFKYEDIRMSLALKGIVLFTSKAEYESLIEKRVTIVSYCGHVSENILLGSINHYNTGILCKSCSLKCTVVNGLIVPRSYDSFPNNIIEGKSIEVFTSQLVNDFDYVRSHETGLHDILIKPKNIKDDLWLPIQLKSTTGETRACYLFPINIKYNKSIFVCISLCNEKIWVFDNIEKFKNQTKIAIGIVKSIYDVYEVNKEDISVKFKQLYTNNKQFLISKLEGIKPQGETSKVEFEYRLLRENNLKFLKFEYPNAQYLPHDFTINGYKIQEKIGSEKKTGNCIFTYFGIWKMRNHKKFRYEVSDNDYYWLHMPNKKDFYLIPEKALVIEDYVGDNNFMIKSLPICNYKSEEYDYWYNKYKFCYHDLDVDRLSLLFLKTKKDTLDLYSELDIILEKKRTVLDKLWNKMVDKQNIMAERKQCKNCKKEISRGCDLCKQCATEKCTKLTINKTNLENLLLNEKLSLAEIGRRYNVASMTIMRKCRKFGINYK